MYASILLVFHLIGFAVFLSICFVVSTSAPWSTFELELRPRGVVPVCSRERGASAATLRKVLSPNGSFQNQGPQYSKGPNSDRTVGFLLQAHPQKGPPIHGNSRYENTPLDVNWPGFDPAQIKCHQETRALGPGSYPKEYPSIALNSQNCTDPVTVSMVGEGVVFQGMRGYTVPLSCACSCISHNEFDAT